MHSSASSASFGPHLDVYWSTFCPLGNTQSRKTWVTRGGLCPAFEPTTPKLLLHQKMFWWSSSFSSQRFLWVLHLKKSSVYSSIMYSFSHLSNSQYHCSLLYCCGYPHLAHEYVCAAHSYVLKCVMIELLLQLSGTESTCIWRTRPDGDAVSLLYSFL